MLPNVIISGAPKCGTTSVFHWLSEHSEVCGSIKKEVQYFMDVNSSSYRKGDNYIDCGIVGYEKYFRRCSEEKKIVLEATPGYIYQKVAQENIPKELPDSKLIFILREPASRLYSNFRYISQNQGLIENEMSFSEYINELEKGGFSDTKNEYISDALEHGFYTDYLDVWFKNHKKENIQLLKYEEIASNPLKFMQELCYSLNIDPNFYSDYDFRQKNRSVVIRNQLIHKIATTINGLLGQGSFKDQFKDLYFRLNSSFKKPKLDDAAESAFKYLQDIYSPYNQKLKENYNFDTTGW